MKKCFKLLLAGIMVFTLVACGGEEKASEEENVKEINIAVSPDYPPYESLDTDGKTIVGFDADMIALFPEYLNDGDTTYKFVWHSMSFENIVSQVQGGQVDIGVSGFTYDKSRKVAWSKPYTATAQVAVVDKDSDIENSQRFRR